MRLIFGLSFAWVAENGYLFSFFFRLMHPKWLKKKHGTDENFLKVFAFYWLQEQSKLTDKTQNHKYNLLHTNTHPHISPHRQLLLGEAGEKLSNNSGRDNTEERVDIIKDHLWFFLQQQYQILRDETDSSADSRQKRKRSLLSLCHTPNQNTHTHTHTQRHTLRQSAGQLRYCG